MDKVVWSERVYHSPPNGEYSRYDHLDYKSSKVRLNQTVHAGEEISILCNISLGMGIVYTFFALI